jgi:hypothetical protein
LNYIDKLEKIKIASVRTCYLREGLELEYNS